MLSFHVFLVPGCTGESVAHKDRLYLHSSSVPKVSPNQHPSNTLKATVDTNRMLSKTITVQSAIDLRLGPMIANRTIDTFAHQTD